MKERLRAHWRGEEQLPPLALAAHYYFNHNLSYGPGFLGWPSSVYMNETRYRKMIGIVGDFDGALLRVETADYEAMFRRYPDDFFYCDPPYLLGGDCANSRMFSRHLSAAQFSGASRQLRPRKIARFAGGASRRLCAVLQRLPDHAPMVRRSAPLAARLRLRISALAIHDGAGRDAYRRKPH